MILGPFLPLKLFGQRANESTSQRAYGPAGLRAGEPPDNDGAPAPADEQETGGAGLPGPA